MNSLVFCVIKQNARAFISTKEGKASGHISWCSIILDLMLLLLLLLVVVVIIVVVVAFCATFITGHCAAKISL
jgi:hypothetical protein